MNTQTQILSTKSMEFFRGIGITLIFGIAVLLSHCDTKSQVREQSIITEEATRKYVQAQQDVLYSRVQREVNQSLDGIRTELAQTNTLLRQITEFQISKGESNIATSNSSVVNAPLTRSRSLRGDP